MKCLVPTIKLSHNIILIKEQPAISDFIQFTFVVFCTEGFHCRYFSWIIVFHRHKCRYLQLLNFGNTSRAVECIRRQPNRLSDEKSNIPAILRHIAFCCD